MKISIITVCFNSALTIADTLESVAEQTYSNFEHIVIDGLSSDGTCEIVSSVSKEKLFLISEADNGIYDAMNKGLKLSSGDIVGFLNSDDFYADPFVLEKIAKAFEDPAVDVCYGDLFYVAKDKRTLVRYWKSKDFVQGDFASGWCPAHPTFYVRRSKVLEHGLFDVSYKLAADVEFMMRYLERAKLKSIYIPNVLVNMRLGGVSNRNLRNIFNQNREIFLALNKNAIPFSFINFFIKKIISRSEQFIRAYFFRCHQ